MLTSAVNEVLGSLRAMGLEERGSITVKFIELAACRLASDTETARLGKLASAPWWVDLDARIEAEASFVPSLFLLLVIAGLIAAIGIVSNSQI